MHAEATVEIAERVFSARDRQAGLSERPLTQPGIEAHARGAATELVRTGCRT
jgi:hypothetical protein